jgi:hypothetical protein
MAIKPMRTFNQNQPMGRNPNISTPKMSATPETTPTTPPTTGSEQTTPTTISTTSTTNPQSYLYDVGLQNIFEDYQKSIQTLSTQEQQSLQDAYYIREMSKKYLGEYASNLGVGDVSGNLLDIYGQYQQTVSNINQTAAQQEMGLEQQYTAARRELELQKTLTQTTGEPTKIETYSPDEQYLSDGTENPYYVEDFDVSVYYGTDKEIGENSRLFFLGGSEYVSVEEDATTEASKDDAVYTATNEDINSWFVNASKDEDSIYFGKDSSPGTIIQYEENGLFYVRGEDGRWYRLKSGSNYSTIRDTATENQKNWLLSTNPANGETSADGSFKFKDNLLGDDTYTLTIGGSTYTTDGVEDTNKFNTTGQTLSPAQKDILKAFEKEHGKTRGKGKEIAFGESGIDAIQKPSAIYYKGKFYVLTNGGRVFELKKK